VFLAALVVKLLAILCFFFTKQKFQNISGTHAVETAADLSLSKVAETNARFLKVGADGANSLVRKKLMPSIAYHAKEYEQVSTF
jgi:hypothetical protein